MRIFITDDHSLVREGIIRLLEFNKEMVVVGFAETGLECINEVSRIKPDVVLLDISLPDINGIEVLKRLKADYPSIKVIMLTVHNDYAFLQEAIIHKADGYLLKDAEIETLLEAIRQVASGETFIQPSLKESFKSMSVENYQVEERGILTKREFEILKLVSNGYSNRNIADELKVSEKTVKNHLSSIFRKIEVSDRTQAAIYAIRNNIFTEKS